MGYIFSLLTIAVYLLTMIFMGRLILDWVQMFARYWRPRGAMLVIASAIYSITDPPMNVARRYIKPLRLGGISLDLGFMILLIALMLLQTVFFRLTVQFS
ncbi:MAG: YggT family protein [Rothia sp. (in: high G+C Gram-positive bacteria)]|nr:YggT family protein [Rothia sp. (in: high G+C Gram-positive bacteria)]